MCLSLIYSSAYHSRASGMKSAAGCNWRSQVSTYEVIKYVFFFDKYAKRTENVGRCSLHLAPMIDLQRNQRKKKKVQHLQRYTKTGPVEYKMYSVNTQLFKQLPLDMSLFTAGVMLRVELISVSSRQASTQQFQHNSSCQNQIISQQRIILAPELCPFVVTASSCLLLL